MIKILHIIDTLSLGGAQTVIKGISESKLDNIEHHIFALRVTDIIKDIDSPNITIHPSSSKYSLAPLSTLRKYIKDNKIDIIHCHLFRSMVFGYLLKRLYFPRIKLIVHEHGRIFSKNYIYPKLLQLFNPSIDAFIAVSQTTIRHLQTKSTIPSEKINLLYNFVDLDRFSVDKLNSTKQSSRHKYNIPNNAFVFGFAGRLIERKGWREFIQAAKIISQESPDIHFIIVGDGADKEELRSLITNIPKVHYLGYYSDMPSYYQMLDCFVIPSHWEPMGITEIEAMAMGIPVIASNIESLNEIIQNGSNGLLFEAKNTQDLAKNMLKLYNNKTLKMKIIKTASNSISQYSLSKYTDDIIYLYNLLKK
jgi:glycosyltransferase involved in cell wall biosynthesis